MTAAVSSETLATINLIKNDYIQVGLERGPLSLVSTIEELLWEKVAAPV
jgi:hypothetical protein